MVPGDDSGMTFSQDLKRGLRTDEVRQLQEQLKTLGFYDQRCDGIFGRGTEAAVRRAQTALFVSGVVDEVTARGLTSALEAHSTDGSDHHVIGLPPRGLVEVKARFGDFSFESVLDEHGVATGYVRPDPAWVSENIVVAILPIVGRCQVHRRAAPAFAAALRDVASKGLAHEIETFAIYSPRHKMTNPKRPLSTHTWGIACDINYATNMPGKPGDMHPEVVASFEKVGFEWGGRWRYRDDMHFQFATGY